MEGFKQTDLLAQRREKEKKELAREAELRLEEALIREAEKYLRRSKRIEDRPVDGPHAVRPRPTLVEIYKKFATDPELNLKEVLDRTYPVYTNNIVYIPTKRQILEPEEQKDDQEDLEEG